VRVGERGLKVACEIRDFIFENSIVINEIANSVIAMRFAARKYVDRSNTRGNFRNTITRHAESRKDTTRV